MLPPPGSGPKDVSGVPSVMSRMASLRSVAKQKKKKDVLKEDYSEDLSRWELCRRSRTFCPFHSLQNMSQIRAEEVFLPWMKKGWLMT